MADSSGSDSLRSYLDELLEELDPLAELTTQADLGDHPQLDLVEPAQKKVQVGRGSPEVLPAEGVVEELVLVRGGGRQSAELVERTSTLPGSLERCAGRVHVGTSCMQLKSSQSNMVIW